MWNRLKVILTLSCTTSYGNRDKKTLVNFYRALMLLNSHEIGGDIEDRWEHACLLHTDAKL